MNISWRQVAPIIQLDYAGLLYHGRAFDDPTSKNLSPGVLKKLKQLGYLSSSSGSFRKVYRIPGENFVLKINYTFDRAYGAAYRSAAEARNYKKYGAKVLDASAGQVRLAETILVSPNVAVQEYVKGSEPSWNTTDDLNETLRGVGFWHDDISPRNYRQIGKKLVMFDLAA